MTANEQIFVLGLGNILCGDDGFGCHVIARLQERFIWPAHVSVLDAGTQSQLMPGILQQADKLLILDAADFNKKPGELFQRSGKEIPVWLGTRKLSAHQGSFAESLALAQLCGHAPGEIHLIGFQPARIEFGKTISRLCMAALPGAVYLALASLKQWGITPMRRASTVPAQIHPDLKSAFAGSNN